MSERTVDLRASAIDRYPLFREAPLLSTHFCLIAEHDEWLEEAGEVELIGGWAEVALAEGFAAAADTTRYQVFVTSYDAVLVFVQNRTPKGFEIHALSAQSLRLPRSTCCAYRVLAPRVGLVESGG